MTTGGVDNKHTESANRAGAVINHDRQLSVQLGHKHVSNLWTLKEPLL